MAELRCAARATLRAGRVVTRMFEFAVRVAKVLPGAVVLAVVAAFSLADAYELPCHEKITSQALRTIRQRFAAARPMPTNANERAFVEDVEFTPESDMGDLGGISLLVGARDNDLKGRGATDLSELIYVHGDPALQDEHCLRTPEQDEPQGSQMAVESCRAFIRMRVAEALQGLDGAGNPDPSRRTPLRVRLSLRGEISADLPAYYVHIGQAIHALQDSFTHMYRTRDDRKVTVALNWIDFVHDKFDEMRDGPAHSRNLDGCEELDEPRQKKLAVATEASIALLGATLDPAKSAEQKMAAANAVLESYLTYAPGCAAGNRWCDAPELKYKDEDATPLGCSSAAGGRAASAARRKEGMWEMAIALMGAGCLAISILGRRRRNTARSRLPLVLFGLLALSATRAYADDAPPPGQSESHRATDPAGETAPPPPPQKPVEEPGPRNPSQGAWGAYLGVSGSLDKPAFAGTLGIRRRVSKHWTFGWDVEWNPWISVTASSAIRPGVLNTFGTAILRFPLAYQSFNLRTTVNLGLSYLLFDLYGASQGATGLYFGVSPLGLEWKMSRLFYLIINPLNIAVPIPQLRGVPLDYPQYRFSIGLELLAG